MREFRWVSGPDEPEDWMKEEMREDAEKRVDAAREEIARLRSEAASDVRWHRRSESTNGEIRRDVLKSYKNQIAVQEAEIDSANAQWRENQ